MSGQMPEPRIGEQAIIRPVKSTLYIASGVSLPLAAVTQRFGIFGISGSGKTYTASVMVEEMLAAGAHVVVLDPLGVWWGLRAAVSDAAESKPLPIYILGGDHADLPLTAQMGAAVASLIVEERLSVVLDLSAMEQEAQAAFAADFARVLYQQSREPLHLIIDEADIFAPETPGSTSEWTCRRAIDTIVRRGRVRGLGVTLLSQRPAVVAKNVLTQTGTLIVHRIASPQDQKAIDGWFRAHGGDEQRKMVMTTLASLPVGEAWLWSPSDLQLFERIRVRKRRTYDSSATPTVGVVRNVPRVLAPVDLSTLSTRLQSVLVTVEENDPTRLRARIVDLTRQLSERDSRPVEVREKIVERIVEKPVLTAEALTALREAMETSATLGKEIGNFHALLNQLVQRTEIPQTVLSIEPGSETTQEPRLLPSATSDIRSLPSVSQTAGIIKPEVAQVLATLPTGERRLLETLARHPQQRFTPAQAATLSRLRPSGGAWNVYLRDLKQHGWIQSHPGGNLQATAEGAAIFGNSLPPTPRTEAEVLALWRPALRRREYEILVYLMQNRSRAVPITEIADYIGVSGSGGTFHAYLSTLKRNGLAIGQRDCLRVGPI
jgi:DNA-binding response OmpR family regulator